MAGNRPAEIVAFEAEMAGFFVEAAELLGVPKSVAAIYGVIFASPVPLSFSEIENRVNFSKGSVSQGLKVLREVGAIKEAQDSQLSVRGLHAFEPDMELRKLILRFIEHRLQTQLTAGEDRLAKILSRIPNMDPVQSERLKNRIDHLAGWHKKARALMPIAKTFLKLS